MDFAGLNDRPFSTRAYMMLIGLASTTFSPCNTGRAFGVRHSPSSLSPNRGKGKAARLHETGNLKLKAVSLPENGVANAVLLGEHVRSNPMVALSELDAVVEARDAGGRPSRLSACNTPWGFRVYHQGRQTSVGRGPRRKKGGGAREGP